MTVGEVVVCIACFLLGAFVERVLRFFEDRQKQKGAVLPHPGETLVSVDSKESAAAVLSIIKDANRRGIPLA